MLQAFVFNETAIIVRHWFEVGPDDDEHGARLEIRERAQHPHRGSESAAQRIDLDGVLWRADLFDLVGDEPGNFKRAHFHPEFEGIEPVGRSWDDDLSSDPFGWAEAQLSDYEGLVAKCGGELADGPGEASDVRRNLPEIMAAARRAAGVECRSSSDCLDATRDTTEIIDMMVSMFRGDSPNARDPRLTASA